MNFGNGPPGARFYQHGQNGVYHCPSQAGEISDALLGACHQEFDETDSGFDGFAYDPERTVVTMFCRWIADFPNQSGRGYTLVQDVAEQPEVEVCSEAFDQASNFNFAEWADPTYVLADDLGVETDLIRVRLRVDENLFGGGVRTFGVDTLEFDMRHVVGPLGIVTERGTLFDALSEDIYDVVTNGASLYRITDVSGDNILRDAAGNIVVVTDGVTVSLGGVDVIRVAEPSLGPNGKVWTFTPVLPADFTVDEDEGTAERLWTIYEFDT